MTSGARVSAALLLAAELLHELGTPTKSGSRAALVKSLLGQQPEGFSLQNCQTFFTSADSATQISA